MKIKAGAGIKLVKLGDAIQVMADGKPAAHPRAQGLESASAYSDFFPAEGVTPGADPDSYTKWQRQPGEAAQDGVRLKVISRTYYDKDADKNYNFCFLLTFSNTGQLLSIEGETREVAFETTLHDHGAL